MGVTTVVDADGDPMHHAVRAEPDVISPNVVEAEELVGHEFNDEEDRVLAVHEMVQLGAREAIMTLPTAVSPACATDGDTVPHRVWVHAARDRRLGRRRRRLPRRLRRRPLRRQGRSRVPALTPLPAAPSRRSASAPGSSSRAQVERLLAEIDVQRLDAPQASAERPASTTVAGIVVRA